MRIYALGVVIEGESSIDERLKVHVRFGQADLLWNYCERGSDVYYLIM